MSEKLAEKLFNGVNGILVDADDGKISMHEAKEYCIGFITTEIAEHEHKQSPERVSVDAIVNVRDYLRQIQGSRKGSIGSIDNTYLPQLNVKRLDALVDDLDKWIEAH